jgi:hypothetical protein
MKLPRYLLPFGRERGFTDQDCIAEISYFKFLFFDEDISSFEISMDDLRRMNGFIAIYDLADILNGRFLSKFSRSFDFLVKSAVLAVFTDYKYLFILSML